jgi:hypothetical protein
LLEAPVANRTNWTIPRLITEIEAREGVRIGRSQLSKALRKKIQLAAVPAHLKGRQSAGEIVRVGLAFSCAKRRPRPATSFSVRATRARL